jgi:hypothetical protein
MVNVGFIVEGPSDARIIRSENFSVLLSGMYLTLIDIIIPEGKTHFFHPNADLKVVQQKVDSYIKILEDKGADKIVFLVDLDAEPCYTSVKSKIPHRHGDSIVICKRALEAWYLADSKLMSSLLKENYLTEFPENIENPFEEIKDLLFEKTGRGVGDKIILANKVIKEGFSLVSAASHPQCLSAAYFMKKLHSLN